MASVVEAEKFVILGEFLCYMVHFLGGYYFVKRVSAVSLMHPNLRLLMVRSYEVSLVDEPKRWCDWWLICCLLFTEIHGLVTRLWLGF